MNFLKAYFNNAIRFFPLIAFVWYARIHNFSPECWENAFIIGSAFSVIQFAILLYQRLPLEPFISAVNLFLLGGGIGFLGKITWLLSVYDNYKQTMLFFWLLVIGIITTLFSSQGFADINVGNKRTITFCSLILLAATGVACYISFLFKGSTLWAGFIPFISLIVLKKILESFYSKNS